MASPQFIRAWHALPLAEVLVLLDADERGLSDDEAGERLARFGLNELPHEPPPTWWHIVVRQFRSPLIYILALAAAVSLAMGHATDAIFIAAVLSLNAAIGGFQEWQAEKSALALQQLLKIHASVERNGHVSEINAESVVPGDIVWLESGNRVPADVRLLSAHGLEIDESLLTGESLAVQKDIAWMGCEASPLADRLNIAHAGSVVARGRAKGIVVATGTATAVGQLALDVIQTGGGKPPLLVRMEKFAQVVAIAVLVSAVVVGLLGVTLQGYGWGEMFLFGVALAVSAIPEGLPVALTVALAIATTRMARRGVIVRKLAAVEGLGSCTLIATDKTGTLTCNELTVREVRLTSGEMFEVTGEGFIPNGKVRCLTTPATVQVDQAAPIRPSEELREYVDYESGSNPLLERFARAAVLCNEADLHQRESEWTWHGDAVDVAFLSFGHKLGHDREASLDLHEQVNQIPFEPERQFAASYHVCRESTDHLTIDVFVKGAPERVLEMCDLAEVETREKMAVAEEMASRGYRVLALAEGVTARLDAADVPPTPAGLTLLGFAGMIDPLRTGARDAVKACREAGVRVTMVTGDHRVTALAIARDLGIVDQRRAADQQVVTGSELIGKTEDELSDLVNRTVVFARVAPQQKLEIVSAAQRAGQFVAVTGDGVNDAAALRRANIGVAMGKGGTDVAREAAELVISDDNFATIVAGIEEGRIAYDNIRKVIYLLVSTGAAEIVLVTLAVISGTPLPLLPVQLLWLNLVTNGIQDVALAFEPGEDDVLRRQPRAPRERIFNRLMIERTIVGATVIGCVGFGAFYGMLHLGIAEATARNALLLLMVLFENVHIGNCRSETQSAFRLSPLRSPILLTGTLAAFLLHSLMLYVPFGHHFLKTEPVGIMMWITLAGLALTVFIAMELHKLTWAWRNRSAAHS